MALKKDHKVDSVEYKDLYLNFEHMIHQGKIEGSNNRSVHSILTAWETEQGVATDRRVCYFEVNFEYDLSSQDNLWTQAYNAAKLLPELEDAEDLL